MKNLLSEKENNAVMDILVEQLGVQREKLCLNAHFKTDLAADSLTTIEIGMAIEEQFDVTFPDEEWEKVSTVGELLDALPGLLERSKSMAPGSRIGNKPEDA